MTRNARSNMSKSDRQAETQIRPPFLRVLLGHATPPASPYDVKTVVRGKLHAEPQPTQPDNVTQGEGAESAPPTDLQSPSNGHNEGRDDKGRFLPGHSHGFRPGESGNPAGPKPGRSLADSMRALLPVTIGDTETSRSDLLARVIYEAAKKGDARAWAEIRKLTEPKRIIVESTHRVVHEIHELLASGQIDESDVHEAYGHDPEIIDAIFTVSAGTGTRQTDQAQETEEQTEASESGTR